MATYNNGSITATVTPPQGYTGDYTYELQENVNGVWTTVDGAAKGYNTNLFINPFTTSSTSHTFGNTGGFDENTQDDATWVGLHPGQYKVVVTTPDGLSCEVEDTDTVGQGDPADLCYGFNITAAVDSDTQITVTVTGGTAPFAWTLNGNTFNPSSGTSSNTFIFNGLQAGTAYEIGVTDNNQCPDIANATTTGGSLTPFECGDTTITIAQGIEGANIPTSAVTANGVTNFTAVYQAGTQVDAVYSNSSQLVDVVFVVPAGYSNSGSSITCEATAPAGGSLTPFECGDTTITIDAGTEGANIPTSAVTANGVTNVTAVYQDGTQTAAVYDSNPQFVDVVFEVPAGYSNSGNSITCDATAPAGTPSTLCDDFNANPPSVTSSDESSGGDGEVEIQVFAGTPDFVLELFDSSNNLEATFTIPQPGTFTFQNLSGGGYIVRVTDDNGCEFETTVTIAGLPIFECGFTTITIDAGTEGANIPTSAVTAAGVTNFTAVYQAGTQVDAVYSNADQPVDVVFVVPAGYSNSGSSITCEATAPAGTPPGSLSSIYLLHAGADTGELPGVYDITDATTYYVNADFDTDSSANALTNAMSYVFNNQGTPYVPNLVEIPNITAINSTQIPDGTINFPPTSNNQPAFFYMIVNQNIDTDLTSVPAFADTNNLVPVAWTSKKAFSWNGADWWIYNTGANDVPTSLSYNCVI